MFRLITFIIVKEGKRREGEREKKKERKKKRKKKKKTGSIDSISGI